MTTKDNFHLLAKVAVSIAIIATATCAAAEKNAENASTSIISSTLSSIVSTVSAAFSSTPAPTPAANAVVEKGMRACGSGEVKYGCWISPSHEDCACGNICTPQEHHDLRFFDVKDDCVAALLSDKVSLWASDPCMLNPCRNGGKCVRTEAEPRYKCLCSASGSTGFTGQNCTERCPPPRMENENKTVLYSHDCLHLW